MAKKTSNNSRLVTLTDEDALTLAAAAFVGRIAYVRDGSISVLPVNFHLSGRDVYVRTGSDTELLDAARDGSAGAFEVDGVIEWSHAGWSVLIRGQLAEVTDFATVESVSRRLEQWVGDGSAVVRLTGQLLTARQIVGAPGAVGINPHAGQRP